MFSTTAFLVARVWWWVEAGLGAAEVGVSGSKVAGDMCNARLVGVVPLKSIGCKLMADVYDSTRLVGDSTLSMVALWVVIG